MIWIQWVLVAVLLWGALAGGIMRANYVLSNRTRKRWNHGKRN